MIELKSWVPPSEIHLKCHSYTVFRHVHIQDLNVVLSIIGFLFVNTDLHYSNAHGDSADIGMCQRGRGGAFEIAVRKRNNLTIEFV